jgi:alanyl-tRNA synthetase
MSHSTADIRNTYLTFFTTPPRNHALIPAAGLIPENDPTTLFTSSGMQQLVPYLKGESHSMGSRLVNSQPCFRAEDIDEVGDNRHITFFEMLGNWSLGDYAKAEQLPWFFEFLTTQIGLDVNRLYVTVFAGDNQIPQDSEAIAVWQKLFDTTTPAQHGSQGFDPSIKIYLYPAAKNWWSRAGVPENMPVGEIGGPDSEVFYDLDPLGKHQMHQKSKYASKPCHINCDCGRFMEIGNSVFMQYIKTEDGFKPLPQQNVDFGGGLERIVAAAQEKIDIFTTDAFQPIIAQLEAHSGKQYQDFPVQMRVITDHLRAATFMIAQGLVPSNKTQGYFLRRLLRRAALKAKQLQLQPNIGPIFKDISGLIIDKIYGQAFFQNINLEEIGKVIESETNRFETALNKGLTQIAKLDSITGKDAFNLFQSYGFPLELTLELAQEKGQVIDKTEFETEFKKHQDISRAGSQALFKGGLANHSEAIVKYHTTTHLLLAALRHELGEHVQQMGSNITAKRLRFDFKHSEKLTPNQLEAVQAHINAAIKQNYPVHKSIEPLDKALQSGALAFFREKYPDTVSVYTIGHNPQKDWHSKELCGGPHVTSTGEIGPIVIVKQEAVGAGIRRIYIQFSNQ